MIIRGSTLPNITMSDTDKTDNHGMLKEEKIKVRGRMARRLHQNGEWEFTLTFYLCN